MHIQLPKHNKVSLEGKLECGINVHVVQGQCCCLVNAK